MVWWAIRPRNYCSPTQSPCPSLPVPAVTESQSWGRSGRPYQMQLYRTSRPSQDLSRNHGPAKLSIRRGASLRSRQVQGKGSVCKRQVRSLLGIALEAAFASAQSCFESQKRWPNVVHKKSFVAPEKIGTRSQWSSGFPGSLLPVCSTYFKHAKRCSQSWT